jgi:hypothetical protein
MDFWILNGFLIVMIQRLGQNLVEFRLESFLELLVVKQMPVD